MENVEKLDLEFRKNWRFWWRKEFLSLV